jgi:hypothetical protein
VVIGQRAAFSSSNYYVATQRAATIHLDHSIKVHRTEAALFGQPPAAQHVVAPEQFGEVVEDAAEWQHQDIEPPAEMEGEEIHGQQGADDLVAGVGPIWPQVGAAPAAGPEAAVDM